jgi:beta-lactamase regulating signal transducer with metallopeptidase domain
MDKLFLSVLNMSLTGAFVTAAVCVVRLPFKKAPKIISYALWSIVAFRLLAPFSIESAFSLIPFNVKPISEQTAIVPGQNLNIAEAAMYSMRTPGGDVHIPIDPDTIKKEPQKYAGTPYEQLTNGLFGGAPYAYLFGYQAYIILGSYLWPAGMAAMLIYGAVSIVRLKRKLRNAAYLRENIYESAGLKTPLVFGLFKPRIYIPAVLSLEETDYILLHEQTHIRRRDHIVKMFAYFVLCLHWFNPLVWLAFLLMGADMEMSCDERVLKELGEDIKDDYSMSLVRIAAGGRILNGCPVAFGEGGIKERVKRVLNFKKPPKLVVASAALLAVALGAGFAVNRASAPSPPRMMKPIK